MTEDTDDTTPDVGAIDAGDPGLEHGVDDGAGGAIDGDGGDDDDDGSDDPSGEADFDSLLAEYRAEGGDPVDPDHPDGDREESKAGPDPDVRPRRQASEERLVVRMQRSEQENLQLRQEIQRLQQEGSPQRFKSSGDLLEDVVRLVTAEMGGRPDGAKLRERLMRLGGDIVAELHGDQSDPQVQARLQSRAAERKNREIQAQIDELRAGNTQKERQLMAQTAVNQIGGYLNETRSTERYPHMHAVETDVTRTIWDGIQVLATQGYTVTPENAADAIEFICKRIDDEHRATAERLDGVRGKKLQDRESGAGRDGNKAARPPTSQQQTRGARKDQANNRREDRGGRTVTASGVGARRAPDPKTELTGDELFEATLAEHRQERSRKANTRRT